MPRVNAHARIWPHRLGRSAVGLVSGHRGVAGCATIGRGAREVGRGVRASQGASCMSEVDLVRRHFEQMWNQRDWAACDELMAEQFVEHGIAPFAAQEPGAGHGPTAMRETMTWLLQQFPDLSYTVEAIVTEGDLVVARVRATGTNTGRMNGMLPPSGRTFDYEQSHWFRVRDGQLAEHWATRDDLTVMLQLGVVTPPRLGALGRQLRSHLVYRLRGRGRQSAARPT